MKIIAATKNKNKLREFGEILKDFEIISQEEAGIDIDVEETGTTFEENSRLKAEAIFKATGIAAIADDSGLCVNALDGRPGVYSARYAPKGQECAKLLEEMKDIPDNNRAASFQCVIAYMDLAIFKHSFELHKNGVQVPTLEHVVHMEAVLLHLLHKVLRAVAVVPDLQR